jgi:hypothetical protein
MRLSKKGNHKAFTEAKQILTQDELKSILRYEPETGEWFWTFRAKGKRFGVPIGNRTKEGRLRIKINYVSYYGYRLAWLYMTGEWTDKTIDHIDGDPSNDRWSNLRQATQIQQCGNQKLHVRNTSGIRGVMRVSGRSWRAEIGGRPLGLFPTKEQAAEARQKAADELWGDRHVTR